MLVLHGVTGHAARWHVLAEALPELRMIAVDLRGHGRSPWTPPWNLEQHVADVLAVLDDLDLARVTVVGHSFGGAIAVHLARTAPERVDGLVLLDPASASTSTTCWRPRRRAAPTSPIPTSRPPVPIGRSAGRT